MTEGKRNSPAVIILSSVLVFLSGANPPHLIRFYGSFRAGMQSLVIPSHLIGHLQDGFCGSNSL